MNIQAINAELAKIGYKAVKISKPRKKNPLTELRAWKPETPAGKTCKSWMLYWASLPPIADYSKPCVDTVLRFLGVKAMDSQTLISFGGFSPKGLWVASLTRPDIQRIA